MTRFRSLIASAVVICAALAAVDVGAARAGDIFVEDAVANLTPSGSGGVFLTIQNQGSTDDSLTGVSSAAAKKAQLHNSSMVDGVMKMRPVKAVEVPAGETVELQHGGDHIMLFGVSKDLKPGDSLDLVLTFAKAGEVPVSATVQAPGGHGAMGGMKDDKAQGMAMGPVEVVVNRISAEGIGESIGTLTLSMQDGAVLLTPALAGLEPGPHAFHLHRKPDCGPGEKNGEMVAGLAAGGHFDPGHDRKAEGKMEGHEAGKDKKDEHAQGHKPAGDLPELVADADGKATAAIRIDTLTLKQMMGRSIMIHAHGEEPADADQAKGGGARIACGVVPKK